MSCLHLKSHLKNALQDARRVAVLGIGSELRSDDAAGMSAARNLQALIDQKAPPVELKIFLGASAPENLSGQIKKCNPSHLIIIDSADFRQHPGYAGFISIEDAGSVSFSTHRMPTKLLALYLSEAIQCQIVIIGIQPKFLEFGERVSDEVAAAARDIALLLHEILITM